jgi:hypothetical protein
MIYSPPSLTSLRSTWSQSNSKALPSESVDRWARVRSPKIPTYSGMRVRATQPLAPPPRTSSQHRRLRSLVTLEHAQLADETRLARYGQAEVTAIRHSLTAAKVDDRVAYSRDRTAVIRSLRQEARLLEQLATVRLRAAATFAALGIGLRATHRGKVKLAAYLSVHGLVSARRGLRRLGVRSTSIGLAGVTRPSSPASFGLREVGSLSPASSSATAARPPPTCA